MDEELINKPKTSLGESFKKHKSKILIIIILAILGIISFIILDDFKKRQHLDISKNYNKAKILIENKKTKEALTILEKIVFVKNSFYSPSALNLIVDNNLVVDKKKILTYYDQIILKSKLDTETKNLYIFKKIIYIGDDIKENELLSSLKPIIQSNSLWKNMISDYIKKYYLSKGELSKAKEFEDSINR